MYCHLAHQSVTLKLNHIHYQGAQNFAEMKVFAHQTAELARFFVMPSPIPRVLYLHPKPPPNLRHLLAGQ